MEARASEESFRTLFEPHRRPITLHCYRMLGSLQDAEEITQETLLRAWQRQGEIRSASATRAWLYQIATNACLDLLKVRRRRALPHLIAPAALTTTRLDAPAHEGLWIEPIPDSLFDVADDDEAHSLDARVSQRESVGLAFVSALQFLSRKQRAALLLIDVLGWTPKETAALLETSVASVNSQLQRARKSVENESSDAESTEPTSDPALLRRYITTWESGDLDAFTSLLAHDAILSMPPQREWFAGRDAIHKFLLTISAARPLQYRVLPIQANAGPAVAYYSRPIEGRREYEPAAISLLTLRDGLVSQMVRFGMPGLFPEFGLPTHLADI